MGTTPTQEHTHSARAHTRTEGARTHMHKMHTHTHTHTRTHRGCVAAPCTVSRTWSEGGCRRASACRSLLQSHSRRTADLRTVQSPSASQTQRRNVQSEVSPICMRRDIKSMLTSKSSIKCHVKNTCVVRFDAMPNQRGHPGPRGARAGTPSAPPTRPRANQPRAHEASSCEPIRSVRCDVQITTC